MSDPFSSRVGRFLLRKAGAIFNNLGHLHDSNPVVHTRVKEYLKFIREEKAGKAIVPSFFLKFPQLKSFLRRSIQHFFVILVRLIGVSITLACYRTLWQPSLFYFKSR